MSFSVLDILLVFVFFVLPQLPAYWVIKKAGWPGWHFLLAIIPIVGIVWLWVFAFGVWYPRVEILPPKRVD